jgi:hypothetical protein
MVTRIDFEKTAVVLEIGEVILGDVIVGADGKSIPTS